MIKKDQYRQIYRYVKSKIEKKIKDIEVETIYRYTDKEEYEFIDIYILNKNINNSLKDISLAVRSISNNDKIKIDDHLYIFVLFNKEEIKVRVNIYPVKEKYDYEIIKNSYDGFLYLLEPLFESYSCYIRDHSLYFNYNNEEIYITDDIYSILNLFLIDKNIFNNESSKNKIFDIIKTNVLFNIKKYKKSMNNHTLLNEFIEYLDIENNKYKQEPSNLLKEKLLKVGNPELASEIIIGKIPSAIDDIYESLINLYLLQTDKIDIYNVKEKISIYFSRILESFYCKYGKEYIMEIDNDSYKIEVLNTKVSTNVNEYLLFRITHNNESVIYGFKVYIGVNLKSISIIPNIFKNECDSRFIQVCDKLNELLIENFDVTFDINVSDEDIKLRISNNIQNNISNITKEDLVYINKINTMNMGKLK